MMADAPLPADYYASTTIADWADVVSFTPGLYFAPDSLDALIQVLTLVLQGHLPGKTVRFLGGRHSCSDIFRNEIVIDITHLPLDFAVGPAPGEVIASAFMHAHEFTRRAAEHNLSLTALGGTDAQTLGGLISTNTAGATVHTSVYETVDWIEYLAVAPDGRSVLLKRAAKTDPEFQALVCSLGALGFLVRVGFTLVPERYFRANFVVRPIAEVLGDIPKTCAENEFWRIEWLPQNPPQGLFWSANRIETAPADGDYPPQASESQFLAAAQADAQIFGGDAFLDPSLAVVYEEMLATFVPQPEARGPMRNLIPCDRLAPLNCLMAEWSFDPADLPRVMQTCQTYFDANKWPNLSIEIECTRTDSYMMSPWNWPGLPYIVKLNFQYLTVYLNDEQKAAIIPHLKGVWDALIAAVIRFKAHWGKINFLDPQSVAQRYDLAHFLPHAQPVFMNEYLRQRLIA